MKWLFYILTLWPWPWNHEPYWFTRDQWDLPKQHVEELNP